MNLEIFSIFDDKARTFATPFFMQNDQMALRAFNDLVSDPNTTIARNPDDYKLYSVGTFDDQTGFITKKEIPEYITSAPNARSLEHAEKPDN